jgi:hypothetical protein
MVIIHSQREKDETQTRGNSFATYRYAMLRSPGAQAACILDRRNKNEPLGTEGKPFDIAKVEERGKQQNTFIHVSARCIDCGQMFSTIEYCYTGIATFEQVVSSGQTKNTRTDDDHCCGRGS